MNRNTNVSSYNGLFCHLALIDASCSVTCSTLHRVKHPADAINTEIVPTDATKYIVSSSKPVAGTAIATRADNPFLVFDSARELETLFLMYPRLRSQLRDIYLATQPPSEDGIGPEFHHMEASRGSKSRGGGRSRLGNRAGSGTRERGPWNPDKGTQDGIDALSKAKDEYGKGGEGMREFVALVLKLVDVDGVDVARMVQEEVAEENARIITQMLTGEGY
ncbi:MAG: hypothetical protein M1818_005446 [Claussenomyces sp. TS43310]|nr:MAG: hypothetical protein M1818_005446 [Claussenomyces sp. TS43310]